jgi:hypothetical protein
MNPRYLLLAALVFAAACDEGPDYTQVQKEDTIEAYEAYEKADPNSIYQESIDKRLEELYYERAQADGTQVSWDAYATKFPEGKHIRDANSARESLAWDAAVATNTTEGYQKFLTDYPKATKVHKARAQGLVDVANYGKLTIGTPVVTPVNLAEDPKGEMNGWGVKVDVTNGGDKDLELVGMQVDWLAADGTVLEHTERPLTNKAWSTPATDLEQTPLKAGETRPYIYTIDYSKVPADAPPTAKVSATSIRAVGAAAETP